MNKTFRKTALNIGFLFLAFFTIEKVWSIKLPPTPANPIRIVTTPALTTQYASAVEPDYTAYFNMSPPWRFKFLTLKQDYILHIRLDRLGDPITGQVKHIYKKGTVNVKFQLHYEVPDPINPAGTIQQTEDREIDLDFDTALLAKEKDQATIVIPNAVKGYINNVVVTYAGVGVTNFGVGVPDLEIESSIEIERLYRFNSAITYSGLFVNGFNPNLTGQEQWVEFGWDPVPGTEFYELEYTFIETPSFSGSFPTPLPGQPTLNTAALEYDFRNNATTIVVNNATTYKIPRIFPKGYIIWRVRAHGKELTANQDEIIGNWSMADYGTINAPANLGGCCHEILTNFNSSLNWDYNISFAENSVNISSLSYFDGTLRDRMNVGYSEEKNKYYINQNIYDYLGRVSVSTLPSISFENYGWQFQANVNQNTSGQNYSFQDFDYNKNGTDEIEVKPMGTSSGAARYFSPQQKTSSHYLGLSNAQKRMQDFTPQAHGYSFAQTEYTRDPSGRTWRVGSVGKTHQLKAFDQNGNWVDGKQTEVYDGTPTQEELDALFGNEVGFSDKSTPLQYKKIMTKDPNGQLSVAYLDPQGRTIATSLAGDPANTPNLDPLPTSSHYLEFTSNIPNTIQNKQDGSMSSMFNLLVNYPQVFKFSYEVNRKRFKICDEDLCFECAYDLEISITNPNKNNMEMMPGGVPLRVSLGSALPSTGTCNDVVQFQLNPNPMEVQLEPGEYFVVKKLIINKEKRQKALRNWLDESNCIRPFSEFLAEEKAKMNLDCEIDCDDLGETKTEILAEMETVKQYCISNNINYETYEDYIKLQTELAELQKMMDEICKKSPCDILHEAIELDMQPGGQYAEYTALDANGNELGLNGITTGLNIFKRTDIDWWCSTPNFSVTQRPWRFPNNTNWAGLSNSLHFVYLNEDNTAEALIPVYVENGVELPAASATVIVDGKKYVRPHELVNVEDFIEYFKANLHWSKSLAIYHPEYCQYLKCLPIKASYEYDYMLLNTSSSKEAADKGFYNPLNMNQFASTGTTSINYQNLQLSGQTIFDPILDFTNPSSPNYVPNLQNINDLKNGILGSLNPALMNCQEAGKSIWQLHEQVRGQYTNDAWAACVDDMFWPIMRALYLQNKNQWLLRYYAAQCPAGNTCTANSAWIKTPRWPQGGMGDMITKATEVEWFKKSDWVGKNLCSVTEAKAIVDLQTADHCQKICEKNADAWVEKIKACLENKFPDAQVRATKIAAIKLDLINVCKGGCDVDNPWGSTSINPARGAELVNGQPAFPEKDIFEVFQKHIGSTGNSWFSLGLCDDLLIDFPFPYGHDYLAYHHPDANKCACDKAKNTRKGVNQRCPVVDEDDFQLVDCACDLPEKLKTMRLQTLGVPPETKCKNCITCKELNEPVRLFLAKYNVTTMEPNFAKALLSNWLNRSLKFNQTYAHYELLAQQCFENYPIENWYDVWYKVGQYYLIAKTEVNEHNSSPFIDLPASTPNWFKGSESEPININNTASLYFDKNYSVPVFNPGAYMAAADAGGANMAPVPPATTPAEKVECECKKVLAAAKVAESTGQNAETAYNEMYSQPGPPPVTFGTKYGPGGFSFNQVKEKCCQLFNVGNTPPKDCPSGFVIGQNFGQPARDHIDQLVGSNSDPLVMYMSDKDCDQAPATECEKKLDTCACNKLRTLYLQYQAHPQLGPPATFEAFVMRIEGVTMDNATAVYNKCYSIFTKGVARNQSGQSLRPYTPGVPQSWWSPSAFANLEQEVQDNIKSAKLKVPAQFSCNPSCNEQAPCTEIKLGPCDFKQFFNNYIGNEWYKQTNGQYKFNQLGAPTFDNIEDYNGLMLDWVTEYAQYLTGATQPPPGEITERVNFLNALKTAFNNYLNSYKRCPNSQLETHDLEYYLSKILLCSDKLDLDCNVQSDCHSVGAVIKSMVTQWPNYTDPLHDQDKKYAFDFENWYYDYSLRKKAGNTTAAEDDFIEDLQTELNAQLNSCYPGKIFPIKDFLLKLYLCRPLPSHKDNPIYTKPIPCPNCYTYNKDWLLAFQTFLNDVTKKEKPDQLTDYSYYIKTNSGSIEDDIQSFYQSILYQNKTDENNLVWTLDEKYQGGKLMPGMKTTIADNQGFRLTFSLDFPAAKDKWNFNYIKNFVQIKPVIPTGCSKPSYFTVRAVYVIPEDYKHLYGNYCPNYIDANFNEFCYDTIDLIGRIWENTGDESFVKSAPCLGCAKLCNMPYIAPVWADEADCLDEELDVAVYNALKRYNDYINGKIDEFNALYDEKCFLPAESWSVNRKEHQYHWTLYYYDLAGQLIKTVPPAGVDLDYMDLNQSNRQALANDRIFVAKNYRQNGGTSVRSTPFHSMITRYKYNTAGQLIWTSTPDGGIARTWYDELGRPFISQNSVQAADEKYHYILYDALSRPIEAGQLKEEAFTWTDDEHLANEKYKISSMGWSGPPFRLKWGNTQFVYDNCTPLVYDANNPAAGITTNHNSLMCSSTGSFYAEMYADEGGQYTLELNTPLSNLASFDLNIIYDPNGSNTSLYSQNLSCGNSHIINFAMPSGTQRKLLKIEFSFTNTTGYEQLNLLKLNLTGQSSKKWKPNARFVALTEWRNLFIQASGRNNVVNFFYDKGVHPEAIAAFGTEGQQHTGKTIACITYKEVYDANPEVYDHAEYYSYTIHGQPIRTVQHIPALAHMQAQLFTYDYEADLLTGKVNKVAFQANKADQWIHKYEYDRDLQVKRVFTSQDGYNWERDAEYIRNFNGVEQRLELGQLKVQGLDFATTIQGLKKGVNGSTLQAENDMGWDGFVPTSGSGISNAHQYVARDAFGYMLSFFKQDYENLNNQQLDADMNGADADARYRDVYNGNIAMMTVALPKIRGNNSWAGATGGNLRNIEAEVLGNVYHYDQLNRITKHFAFDNFTANPAWGLNTSQVHPGSWGNTGQTGMDKYHEVFSYDANGNIQTLDRNAGIQVAGSYAMDRLQYRYHTISKNIVLQNNNTFLTAVNITPTNKLEHVNDAIAAANFEGDIDNNPGVYNPSTPNTSNYRYDELGNLVQDGGEEIDNIVWNAIGKIKKIIRNIGSKKPDLEFGYNWKGNRLWKLVIPKEQSGPNMGQPKLQEHWDTTWYINNEAGQTTAIYKLQHLRKPNSLNPGFDKLEKQWKLEELAIQGNSRLGLYKPELVLATRSFDLQMYAYTNGQGGNCNPCVENRFPSNIQFIEQEAVVKTNNNSVDPLGFVYLLQVRGNKQYELSNHLGNVMVTVSDRKWSRVLVSANASSDYFLPYIISIVDYYAFGSSMASRSWSAKKYRYGFNNQEQDSELGEYYVFEYRIHDARLGRFLSVDPLEAEYPWNSTYAFAENDVIRSMDLEGLEKFIAVYSHYANGNIRSLTILRVTKDETSKVMEDLGVFDVEASVNTPITTDDVLVIHKDVNGKLTYEHRATLNELEENVRADNVTKTSKEGTEEIFADIRGTQCDEVKGEEVEKTKYKSKAFDRAKYTGYASTKDFADNTNATNDYNMKKKEEKIVRYNGAVLKVGSSGKLKDFSGFYLGMQGDPVYIHSSGAPEKVYPGWTVRRVKWGDISYFEGVPKALALTSAINSSNDFYDKKITSLTVNKTWYINPSLTSAQQQFYKNCVATLSVNFKNLLLTNLKNIKVNINFSNFVISESREPEFEFICK